VKGRGRYEVQTLKKSIWHTQVTTNSRTRAEQSFLAHTTKSHIVRIVDTLEDLVIAHFSAPVHTAPADSTC
jgi:hypothetical protein